MFSAAAATRLATKKGASSLLSTSLFKSTAKTPSKLAALARSSQSRNLFSRPDPEVIRSALGPVLTHWKPIVGGLALTTGVVHLIWGNEDNFYDKRFILDCDPDDIADFYGSENFMDLYCILPFMGTLMMRGSYFDDEGTVHSQGLPFGELLVSMVFSDSDEDGDGNEPGKWFNKRERFKNECFGGKFTMWDMITNFGFETLEDGRVMVYHHGEYFYGNLPPLSLIMSAVFRFHSHIVIKTTEHHLRYYAFRNDTEFDEHCEHESRDAMPIFWLKNYNPLKVISYILFNTPLDMPEHLRKKRAEAMAIYKAENPDEDEEEETEEEEEEEKEEEDEEVVAATLARKKTIADAALSRKHTLPVQRPEIMRRITLDIQMDKAQSMVTLAAGPEEIEDDDEMATTASAEKDEEDEAVDAIVASKASEVSPTVAARKRATLRRIATNTALKRFQTSLNKSAEAATPTDSIAMKRSDTKALKALENADPNDNMKAAALAARAKMLTRKATKMSRRATSLIRPSNIEQAMNFEIKNDAVASA
eukprot:CAMPEP_0197173366 /NCGR_PEP_ID=MMETSP1423-20130617/330_1 /TAXON_ID=476441 /ORGANISM="Pseudo-nitzschia heimii, Strain UNC1101" /LENGTH=534 /DNA_ID=CAMNT_0042622177 /DNA_START=115 /DNA_END=1719 /DNA_ORIENTATION=-